MRAYLIQTFINIYSGKKKGSVVFLGDSLTAGFKRLNTYGLNQAINSTGVYDLKDTGTADKVFIQTGINDLLNGVPVSEIAGKMESIISKIDAQVYVHSLLPTNWYRYGTNERVLPRIVELNGKLKAICDKHGLKYIDLHPLFLENEGLNKSYDSGDSLHLNEKGYRLWWDTIKHYIN